MATPVAMESDEDIITTIHNLLIACSKSVDLDEKIENLNDEELNELCRILKKIQPKQIIKKKKKENLFKKLNEKECKHLKINTELQSLRSSAGDVTFDNTINACIIVNNNISNDKISHPEEVYKTFDSSLDTAEKNGIQCSMIVAKLRYEMFNKYRRDNGNCRIESVHAMFDISPRTYTYLNTFYKLITEYPQLLRMRLAWSTVAKYKQFIISELINDADLQYICAKPYNPFANTPAAPRPRTVST